MEIFKLIGSILVDSSSADESIAKTDKKAQGVGETLLSGIGTATKWGAAIVGGATAAVGAVSSAAKSSASAADTIDKMSQKIGISREAYQELDFITSQCGMSIDKFQVGMKTLTTVMDTTRDGTAKSATALEQLGISATNADGSLRSSEEVMFETITALQNMENETERAKLASELFGKAGTEMAPLLNSGAGAMEEMRQQAHDLGLVLSDELIDNGVNLTDSLDQTKRAFQSIATQIGGSFMPYVEQASDYIQTILPDIQEMLDKLSPTLTDMFEAIVPSLLDLSEAIVPVIIDLLNEIIPIITDIAEAIIPIITEAIGVLIDLNFDKLLEWIRALITGIRDVFSDIAQNDKAVKFLEGVAIAVGAIVAAITAWNAVQAVLNVLMSANPLGLIIAGITAIIALVTIVITYWDEIVAALSSFGQWVYDNVISPVIDFFTEAWESVKRVFSSVVGWIQDNIISPITRVFTGAWNTIKNGASKAWEGIKSVFSAVGKFFSDTFSKAWKKVKDIFSTGGKIFDGIKEGIVSAFKTVVNTIIKGINKVVSLPFKGINKALEKIRDISILGVSPFDWIKTIDIPEIPLLARGGVLSKGQVGVLEGTGAEAVVPLENNKKWISAVSRDMSNAGIGAGTEAILLDILSVLEQLLGRKIYLDTDVLVGELAMPINKQLGRIAAQKARA